MSVLNIIRVLVPTILIPLLEVQSLLTTENRDGICDKVTRDPQFSEEMVLGKTWRVYYTWHLPSEKECLEVSFKRAHRMIIGSVRSTMRPYLINEPNWDAATLYMKVAPLHYRGLLIPDPNRIPGRFDEVAHLPQYLGRVTKPSRKQLETFKVALKLLRGGRYLAFSHCSSGCTYLMAPIRKNDPKPDRNEIKELAQSLDLGYGLPACIQG